MIKVNPEEFIVVEKAILPLASSGAFLVYRLRKRGLTTEEACRLLARKFQLPFSSISYGGRKDKHGLTTQYIAIHSPLDCTLRERNLEVEPIGYMDRPMGPDLIQGNSFRLVIRRLEKIDYVLENIEEVKAFGLPNFFDDQRFRSYDPQRGFFAEKILRRHWNGALQVYLTSITASMRKREKERRRAWLENWKNWRQCLEIARRPAEKKIFSTLVSHPERLKEALGSIPPQEVSFLYASYQAHLWNELLRRLIRARVKSPLLSVAGKEGGYLFWRQMEAETTAYFSSLQLPNAARTMEFPDELSRSVFEEILKEKGLTYSSFRTKALRLVSFRSFLRPAALFPSDLEVVESSDDELYPGKKKLTLSFSLGRGSYGTMLIKRLTISHAS